jgi:hypothetical protein
LRGVTYFTETWTYKLQLLTPKSKVNCGLRESS